MNILEVCSSAALGGAGVGSGVSWLWASWKLRASSAIRWKDSATPDPVAAEHSRYVCGKLQRFVTSSRGVCLHGKVNTVVGKERFAAR